MNQPPDAVLFDMDGTLIDSVPVWREIGKSVLAQHGYEVTDEIYQQAVSHMNGSLASIRRARQILLASVGADRPVEWLEVLADGAMVARMRSGMPWMPGARQLLNAAREHGVPTALVTTSPRLIADAWLGSHDHPFDATVTGDEVGQGKPHPEPYLTAARALGVDPARCVAFEDTVNGYASATAAGCVTFMVSPYPHSVERRVPTLEHIDVGRLKHYF